MSKTIRNFFAVLLALLMATSYSISTEIDTGSGSFTRGFNESAKAAENVVAVMSETEDEQENGLIVIRETADSGWGIQLSRSGISLEKGKEYNISFEYGSDLREAILRLHKSGDPGNCYLETIAKFTPESNSYSFHFVMEYDSEPNCVFVMELSRVGSENKNIAIQNFTISSTEEEIAIVNPDVPNIHVDQLGYLNNEKKYAVIISDDPLFAVYNAENDRQVFAGRTSEPVMSYSASEYVRIADFSELTADGVYYIKNSEAQSYNFTISNGSNYKNLAESLFGMYSYQKCGTDVDDGKWSYDACHTEPAYIYGTDTTLDVSGGWHNSGDYGRYVVPATKAVADILLAYELGYTSDEVLNEVRYELEWLLKMQDSITGGVYHKVTAEKASAEVMPDKDTDKLIISPISASATADFSAVTAMAARIYTDEFSNVLIAASRKAWSWLESNPNSHGFKNPEGITTDEYSDESSLDERYWAACELFHTTGEENFHNYVKNSVAYQGFGWADMGFYGSISYLNTPVQKIDVETFFRIEASILDAIQRVIKSYYSDPYMISLGLDYPFGSNMNAANNAMLLVFAVRMLSETDYIQPLRDHVHYLLGRNAISQSYVTGFGTRQVLNPYHKPSELAGKAVPGMLVGGPNDKLDDPIALAMLKGYPPAKAYIDNYYSYSTNSVSINWNSPLYFVLSFLNNR